MAAQKQIVQLRAEQRRLGYSPGILCAYCGYEADSFEQLGIAAANNCIDYLRATQPQFIQRWAKLKEIDLGG